MKFSLSIVMCFAAPLCLASAFVVRPTFAAPHSSASCTSSSSTECSATSGVDVESLHPYYKMKTSHVNTGLTHPSPEGPDAHSLGLTPRGPSISYDAKVDNLLKTLAQPQFTDLDKYNILHTIQDSDEKLYYKAIMENTHLLMPFVYTPTVGTACLKWGEIARQVPRGIYLSKHDKGNVLNVLKNHPFANEIKAIVVTDGERILGLGDLGTNGMGIPVGKLALYTALGGIKPESCLPIHIDVGTNNIKLRESPMYGGLREDRIRQHEGYDELLAEFFAACKTLFGERVLIQFEDFGNLNAFRLLEEYQNKATCFNDDIQGTAAVVLAGVITSLKLTPAIKSLSDHKFLFNGAGEAGVGIANLIALAIQVETGCTPAESTKNIWLVDSQGLVTDQRDHAKLAHHKHPYAHKSPTAVAPNTLTEATKALKPTALIGVSAQPQTFTEEILKLVASYTPNPIVFALSNPTSKAECTAKQAYDATGGKCVFASGSPFDPVTLADGEIRVPGQGNNAYIFPGIGLGALVAGSTRITDEDMYIAAKTLSKLVPESRLKAGAVYPALSEAREVAAKIAEAVAENAYNTGVAAEMPRPKDMYKAVKDYMWSPGV